MGNIVITNNSSKTMNFNTTSNKVLNFSPINVTATFDSNGGTPTFASQTGLQPFAVVSPGSPTKSGFNFTGYIPTLPRSISVNTTFVAQFVEIINTILIESNISIDSAPDCGTISGLLGNSNNFGVTVQYRIGISGSYITLTTLTANQQNKSFAISGFGATTPYTFDIYFRYFNANTELFSTEVRKNGTIDFCIADGGGGFEEL